MANVSQRLALAANHSASRSLKEMWDLRAHNPVAVRLGKAALIDLPARTPPVHRAINYVGTHGLLGHKAARRFPGYEVIGGGGEQIVLASGNKILKLVMDTQSVNMSSLEAAAEQLQKNSERCREYLGEQWVPTDFSVTRVPRSYKSIITATQPLIDVARFYEAARDMVDDDDAPVNMRIGFGEDIRALHTETGLLPDLLGKDNVGRVADGLGQQALRIVDTIAVTPMKQELPWGPAGGTVGTTIQQELNAMVAA